MTKKELKKKIIKDIEWNIEYYEEILERYKHELKTIKEKEEQNEKR